MKYRNAAVAVCIALASVLVRAQAAPLKDAAIVGALRSGGFVIVMRHASSPTAPPTRETAETDNVKLERQLDEAGRKGATDMGRAIRALRIPIGDVLTSPTYRALQTVRLARLPDPKPYDELGDGGQSMQAAGDAQAAWLRTRVSQVPRKGTNTIIVTHLPNLSRAFPDWGPGVADGESVILKPSGDHGVGVAGRVRIDEWPGLAAAR